MDKDDKARLDAAYKLLSEDTTTIEKFESIRTLIKGINPTVDKYLENCSANIAKIQKLQKGEVIDLSVEFLPENTEEEKRRKKVLLLLIKNWNKLKSEVKRVKSELEKVESEGKLETSGRIIAYAKGPFGLITAAALLIAGFMILQARNTTPQKEDVSPTAVVTSKPKIKAIIFDGKKIPLSEVEVRTGPDCDSPHYHAKDHIAAQALDGSVVQDPGACGFGREKDVSIIETSF